jgi:hypothetical protein
LVVVTACAPSADPEPSTTTAAPVTTTTEAPATTTTTTPPTTLPATTVPAVSERQFGFVEPFTVDVSADWVRLEDSTQLTMAITSPTGNGIAFAVTDRATVEEWSEFLTTTAGIDATEPVDAEVGGAPGFTVDVRLSAEATNAGCGTPDPCVALVPDTPGWVLYPGYTNRVWVVDVGGRAVFIAAEATEGSFESFVAEAEEILATVTWTEG